MEVIQFDMIKIAKRIDWPLKEWPGNCFAIAVRLVERSVLVGKPIYGHYHGPINPDCKLFAGRAFTHHGWIEHEDGIIDPTRWVFECTEPYLHFTHKGDTDYDAGGNRVRKMYMRPAPPWVEKQNQFDCPLPLMAFAKMMLGENYRPTLCAQQVGWLASLPLDMLEDQAEPLFRWVAADLGIPGFIPIDNRLAVLGK